MNHIDEGQLQAYADNEVSAEERAHIESHLGSCLACRRELDGLRELSTAFSGNLAVLSAPPAKAEYAVGFPRITRPARGSAGWWNFPRAAAMVMIAAGAASAMVPGTPLYNLIRSAPAVVEETRVAATAPAEPAAPQAMATSASTAYAEAGVSVEPVDDAVTVALTGASPELAIRSTLTESPRLTVLGRGAAADARFETGPGRVEVSGAAGGELLLEVPRSVGNAVVTVNGREYVRKAGDRLELLVPADSQSDAAVVFHP